MAGRAYFAYGSNMSSAELHAHCPGAISLGRARLDGWRLAFTIYSERRQGGVADIVPDLNAAVWGVLWTIPAAELPALDRKEGYAPGRSQAANVYAPVDLNVLLGGVDGTPVEAYAYQVVRRDGRHVPPHPDYLAIILRGAAEHAIPTAAIRAAAQDRQARLTA